MRSTGLLWLGVYTASVTAYAYAWGAGGEWFLAVGLVLFAVVAGWRVVYVADRLREAERRVEELLRVTETFQVDEFGRAYVEVSDDLTQRTLRFEVRGWDPLEDAL